MTSNKISQMAALMKNSELLNSQKTSQEENNFAFGALLSQTTGGNQDLFSWNGNLNNTTKTNSVNQDAYVKESAQSGVRGNSITRTDNTNTDIQNKLPEDAKEKLEEFGEKLTKEIAEELGVTEEEVKEIMEELGLSILDLTIPSKLANLVMELTGSEDIGALLLSEDFQQLLGSIKELSQDLMTQLNLTPEEMKQFVEQMSSMEVGEDTMSGETPEIKTETETTQSVVENNVTQNIEETMQNPENSQNLPTNSTAEQKGLQEVVQQENETTIENFENYEEEEQLVTAAEAEQETQNAESEENAPKQSFSETSQDAKGNEKTNSQQNHITYQTTTQTVNQGQAIEITQTVVQTRIDVEEIMRQVSQMTRVMVSQSESSIEMQLNPANLGKVYLQIVSRQGAITAQIAAQNAAVKEALESQVAILKENMNQQGIKVEAIEVTIASHEFERNLEQNQQNATREQQEAEAQKTSRKNINLNRLEELEGLMSEEENLVAKIMSEQGNSVDLTA